MAASILASAKGTDSTVSTSHIITMPDDVSSGNLLFVCFGCYGNDVTITIASGGDWILTHEITDSNTTLILAYKVATSASESLTLTTSSSVRGSHIAFSIIDYSIPNYPSFLIDYDFNSGLSSNAEPPYLFTSYGSKEYLWFAFLCTSGTVIATDVPTSFTSLYTQQGAASESASLSFAERTYIGESLTSDGFTNSSASWITAITAIQPEVVGEGGIGFSNIGIFEIS